jgi:hypothetical protein
MDDKEIVELLSSKLVAFIISEIGQQQDDNRQEMAKPSGKKRLTRKAGKISFQSAVSSVKVASSASAESSVEGKKKIAVKPEISPSSPSILHQPISLEPRPFVPHPLSLGVPIRIVAAAMTMKYKEKQVSCVKRISFF